MDNAEENIYTKQAIRSDLVLCEMGTIVEYTAPYTPQQNGKVECAFPTLFGRARAACNGAKLPVELCKKSAPPPTFPSRTEELSVVTKALLFSKESPENGKKT